MYRALKVFMATAGNPISLSTVNMNSCEMLGNADAKSMSRHAPCSSCSEVIMLLVSTPRRLARVDLIGKNPTDALGGSMVRARPSFCCEQHSQ